MRICLFLIITFFTFLSFNACSSSEQTPLINGYPLPNITLADLSGNEVDLATINKDKIILVEFWASWCQPCREKHPELNRVYATYKDKKFKKANGFEIYYVNLDKKETDWLKAMKKDKIDHWTYHVADLRGMKKSDLPERFGFEQIPTSFLIDANGTIIGKDLSEDRMFHILRRRLIE